MTAINKSNRFPVALQATGPLSAAYENGVWQVGFDASGLQEFSDGPQGFLSYDAVSDTLSRVGFAPEAMAVAGTDTERPLNSAGVAAAIDARAGREVSDGDELAATTVPTSLNYLRLARYSAGSDALPHVIERRLSASLATRDSADGAHWAPVGDLLTLDHFGGGRGSAADDTRAFFAMIEEGKVVTLGPRIYKLDRDAAAYAALISGDVYIRGVARHASVLEWAGAASTESLLKFDPATVNRLIVDGVTLDGKRGSVADNSAYFATIDFAGLSGSQMGMRDTRMTGGRIQDVRVIGPTADGERIRCDLHRVQFDDGMPGTATRAAIYAQMQGNVDWRLVDCDMSLPVAPASYGRAGLVVQRGGGMPVTSFATGLARGNRFRYIGRSDADTLGCVDVYSGGGETIIESNLAIEARGRAFSIKGDQSNMVLARNIVKGCRGPSASTNAIVMFQDLFDTEADYNAVIDGNVIDGCDGTGIFIDGEGLSGARYKNVHVRNNTISGCADISIYARYVAEYAEFSGNTTIGGTAGIGGIPDGARLVIRDSSHTATTSHVINFSGTLTSTNLVIDNVRIGGTSTASQRGVSLPAVKSYRINRCDIDDVIIGVVTAGSTEDSKIDDNKFGAAVTTVWSKSGSDTLTWFGDLNRGATDLAYSGIRNQTVASGVLNVCASWHYVTGEGGVADDVTSITGLPLNHTVALRAASATVDITIKDGTGIRAPGDFVLTHTDDVAVLSNFGGTVFARSVSDNAA